MHLHTCAQTCVCVHIHVMDVHVHTYVNECIHLNMSRACTLGICVYVYMSCMYGYTSECVCKYISNTVRMCSLDTNVHSIYAESCMEGGGEESSALSHLPFSAPMYLSTFVSLTLCTVDPAYLCGTRDLAPSLFTYHLLTCACRENKHVYVHICICTRICIVYL